MTPDTFRALVVEETAPGEFSRSIRSRSIDDLPPGELLVRVHFSSLNFKDALSALGRPGVTRAYPHTPGIDAAGEVVACSDGAFRPGEKVIVTGHDLGMNTAGGYGEYIRVPSAWGVRLPEGLTLEESMAIGTAGLTAGLCLNRLLKAGVSPGSGEVLVTGATGGVGSVAVAILSRAGFTVVAVTGKSTEADYLRALGAAEILPREEFLRFAERPLLKERWAGAVDVVGGDMLACAVKSARYGGVVTCCGLAGSPELPLNVYPFILRGVSLLGVDSAQAPTAAREEVWQQLSGTWRPQQILEDYAEVTLSGLEERFAAIVAGQLRGRTVVSLART